MSDTITITGNIATEPENKRLPTGVSITTFRVASTQRRYDRASGAWVDSGTNWYSVSTFRSLAEHAFQSLRKGDRVLLTGRLRLRPWDTGTKQGTSAEIDAEAIGHDLLWGTTRFEKDGAPAQQTADSSPASEQAWPTPTTRVVPDVEGNDAPSADEWGVPQIENPRELALASSEAPF